MSLVVAVAHEFQFGSERLSTRVGTCVHAGTDARTDVGHRDALASQLKDLPFLIVVHGRHDRVRLREMTTCEASAPGDALQSWVALSGVGASWHHFAIHVANAAGNEPPGGWPPLAQRDH